MIHALAAKSINRRLDTGYTGITNGGTAALVQIDRLGYDFASIDVSVTTADSTSNKPSVLKLQESDDTVLTNFANVSGSVGGTDFTIPSADTANEQTFRFDVNLKGRKRYLQVVISPRTTQEISMNVRLSRAKESPATTTAQGVGVAVRL